MGYVKGLICKECKKEYGEEYEAVIGTHHCIGSWDKFIKDVSKKKKKLTKTA